MASERADLALENAVAEVAAVAYNLAVRDVRRIKSVYRLRTEDGGIYFLKPVANADEARISALYRCISTCTAAGVMAAAPIPTKNGRFLVPLIADRFAYLQPAVMGRHADFSVRQQRLTAIAAVAHLHTRAPLEPALARPPGLPLVAKLTAKRTAFHRVLPRAAAYSDALGQLPPAILRGLTLWSERDLAADHAVLWARFCHRDLAPHNLMLAAGRPGLTFIDFDLAGTDHPFVDLLQIANHSLSLCSDVAGLYTDVVEVYRDLAGLDAWCESWLWRLFSFPELLVRAILDFAQDGYAAAGEEAVVTAIAREQQRMERLAQECPLRVY